MTGRNAGEPGSWSEQGRLLCIVEERLTARGFQVRRMPDPRSRLVKVAPISVASPAACPNSEVVVEDDGYVEVRYWPPANRPADPEIVADLVAEFLSRNLSDSPEVRS